MMNKRIEKPGEELQVVADLEDHTKQNAFLDYRRNGLSGIVTRLRKAYILQPMHRRYGPIKYNHVLPAYRKIKGFIRPDLRAEASDKDSYQRWANLSERIRYDRERAARNISRFAYNPTISLILPVHNTREEFLRDCLASAQ